MLKRKGQDDGGTSGRKPATDPLTGLPGRAQLRGWLADRTAQSRATSERMGMFVVGVGNLDEVNDTHGPDIGDRVLAEAAQRLVRLIGNAGRVARYNGAEFAAIIHGVGTVERCQDVAQELLGALGEPFVKGEVEISVFSHVGAALSDPGYRTDEMWLEDAHRALGEARARGFGSIVVRDESTRNRVGTLINDERVRHAFANEEFVVVYQPIVTPSTGAVVGFEALLRWLNPSSGAGLIAPGQFLPVLEKTGLITPVGNWALEQAVAQMADWNNRRCGQAPFFVSVNLGAKQIAQATFADSVTAALDAVSFKPELLSLDITPAALKYNKKDTWNTLRGLKALGVRMALDDFGVGDSSLGYLRELPIDLLRIDRRFIEGLGQTPEDTAIVRHLIGLGRDLEILTLAEGVETLEQDAQLREMWCPLAQGWQYGRPEIADELEAKLF